MIILRHITAQQNQLCVSKPHTGTTSDLHHVAQFAVSMREEPVPVCVGMRGDAGQVK